MPAPARVSGRSPFHELRAVHPPRTPEPRTTDWPVIVPSPLGLAVLWCAFMTGVLGGLALTQYWREIAAVVVMTLVSLASGWAIFRADRRTR